MPEATVVCIDDSEFMRNGDLAPTRLEAVRDAVNMACGNLINSHPENSVGVMTLSDRRETLVTLTTDQGKILTAVHGLTPKGDLDLIKGVQVAQLQIKYMQNAAHQKRIIAFVGSPIEASEKELVTLGKKLKKSNIAIDIVSFGETDANTEKLTAFIEAVNKGDRSHLVTVPAGVVLSDALMMSDIFSSGGGGMGGSGGGGANDFAEYGGVNPDLDPELALALRVSMEEERARQQKELAASGDAGGTDGTAATDAAGASSGAAASAAPAPMEEDDADAELRAAMAMSMASMEADSASEAAPSNLGAADNDLSVLSEEEQIARALAMSMSSADDAVAMETESAKPADAASSTPGEDMNKMLADPSFLTSVLSSLPNVDPNDTGIRDAVADLVGKGEKNDDETGNKEESSKQEDTAKKDESDA